MFLDHLDDRLPAELTKQQLEQTFGTYPIVVTAQPLDSLAPRLEQETLYVLSHLCLQNDNVDLIFTNSGIERLNACLAELERCREQRHEQLFVWEPPASEKKWQSYQHILWIALAALVLYAAGWYSESYGRSGRLR